MHPGNQYSSNKQTNLTMIKPKQSVSVQLKTFWMKEWNLLQGFYLVNYILTFKIQDGLKPPTLVRDNNCNNYICPQTADDLVCFKSVVWNGGAIWSPRGHLAISEHFWLSPLRGWVLMDRCHGWCYSAQDSPPAPNTCQKMLLLKILV